MQETIFAVALCEYCPSENKNEVRYKFHLCIHFLNILFIFKENIRDCF